MATRDQIIDIIGALKMVYPNFGSRLTEDDWNAMPDVWHRLLNDIPFELLDAAAMNHASASGSAFPPSVAELREAALSLVTDAPSAEEAWGEVRAAMGRYGHRTPPSEIPFSSPTILKTVQIMNWLALCMSENEVADRAHFLRIYATLHEREKRDALRLPEVRNVVARLRAGDGRMALPRAGDA